MELVAQLWTIAIKDYFQRYGPLVRVCVVEANGSTPREAGAAMLISNNHTDGTIGGGALEFDAIALARSILAEKKTATWQRSIKDYALGPSLGQCCGGAVRLLFEPFDEAEINYLQQNEETTSLYVSRPLETGEPIHFTNDETGKNNWLVEPLRKKSIPLYLYGAGHVGREIVRVFDGMNADIVWIDDDETRFPQSLPANVSRIISATPAGLVEYAPADAFHVVMTYSHPLDLEICHAVLKKNNFRYLGLIGSKTKRASFEKKMRKLGLSDAAFVRLICPIGIAGITSKEPSSIAISLAAQILNIYEAGDKKT